MASVKLVLKKNKANAQGEIPFYIRIIQDRKTRFISLGKRIRAEFWDSQNERVRKSHPNSKRLNAFLAKKVAEVHDAALQVESASGKTTGEGIKQNYLGKGAPPPSFLNFFEKFLLRQKGILKPTTHQSYVATFNKLKEYLAGKDLLFGSLSVPMLNEFEDHLRENLGNSTNTIHTNLKRIRKVVNEAIREGIISMEQNPFLQYKLKWEKTQKEYLSEAQIQTLEALSLVEGSMKFHHRNMYIFSCYAGGLRISDVLQLQWLNYDGERLNLKIQKTEQPLSIKLPTKARIILESYRPEKHLASDYIFPILSNEKDYSDPSVLYSAISSATAYTNKDLKALAKKCEIPHSMNFHTSRHTWATRALRKGMRIEYVSKLMGHSSVKTTEIYAKIVNKELDKAMEVFED